jgi:Asp-tRNA(Asn)/Glu-tRNA(Gln) amidotransferase A subunit family amidase
VKTLSLFYYFYSFPPLDESTALEEAQKISKDQPRSSLVSGTLISVKDNFFVKKTRTSAASKALENLIAPYDATVVKSLRDKSAIIFGKVSPLTPLL